MVAVDLKALPGGELFFQVEDGGLIISYAISKEGIEDIEICLDHVWTFVDDQYLNFSE
jgi:hypothetical protein